MQSARLKYETIKQGHERLLFTLYTDVKLRQYLCGVLSEEAAQKRAKLQVESPPENHWILKNENEKCVGLISLADYYDGVSTEASYTILPKYWRRGYASEAIKYIVQWAADNVISDRLVAETQSANLASRRLLEKLNFQPIGEVERFGQPQTIYQINLLDLDGDKI